MRWKFLFFVLSIMLSLVCAHVIMTVCSGALVAAWNFRYVYTFFWCTQMAFSMVQFIFEQQDVFNHEPSYFQIGNGRIILSKCNRLQTGQQKIMREMFAHLVWMLQGKYLHSTKLEKDISPISLMKEFLVATPWSRRQCSNAIVFLRGMSVCVCLFMKKEHKRSGEMKNQLWKFSAHCEHFNWCTDGLSDWVNGIESRPFLTMLTL